MLSVITHVFNGRFALARHQRQSLLAVLAATVVAGALALAAVGPLRSVAEPDTPIPVQVVETTAPGAATDTRRSSGSETDIDARSLEIAEPAAPVSSPAGDGSANDRARATNPPPTAPQPTEPAPTDPPETPSSETQPPETQPPVTLPPETQPTVTLPPQTRPTQSQPTVTQPTPTPSNTGPSVTQPPDPEPAPTIFPLPTVTNPEPDDDDD
ncbi:MAG: hypothetical protein ACR2QO_24750 [Acidimicrobiales bacterium]